MSTNSAGTTDSVGQTLRRNWLAWLRLVLLLTVLAGVTGVGMVLPLLPASLLPTGRVVLEVGDIAPHDIRAPRRITYESALLRAEEQERAAAEVEPVYTRPNPALARQQLDRARQVLDYLGSVRADTLASSAQQRGWIMAVPELAALSSEMLNGLIDLAEVSWDRVQFETLAVVDQAMRREIREGYLEDALETVPAQISLDLSNEETIVTIMLAQQFLIPNSFLDPLATDDAQTRARENVSSVLRTFEANQIIVREGQRVEAINIEALDQLELRQPRVGWLDWVTAGLLAALLTLLFALYLARFQPDVLWDGHRFLLLVLLTSLSVLAAGLMVPEGAVLQYLAPAPTLAMLATVTLGPHVGVATAAFLGCAVGVIADNSLEMAAYATVGGLIAVLVLGRVERISALFRAGICVALVHMVILTVFHLPQGITRPGELLITMLSGIASGGISASLALGGLFIIGPLFDIATTIRLIELSRPDHPLLKRLLREAPATYHHSLMVANLAEQAAERIDADALLTRVGAYYHDVGKIARPYFFTENQVEGVNPHDRLDPHTSAEVIISHVKDGLELARRYRLPRRVRAFIPEHHGTNWVSFLYDKALQLTDDATLVDPNDFHHQGPKPQSKETALVMLADGCEAAVRSARPNSAEEVAEVINHIIDLRMAGGQLNECDLTLHDLDIIRETFTSVLRGVFHPRIKYPPSERVTDGEVES
ncbi:MAG: HDIG domain-containing protein [Chloroflexota bacterium]|nr:HDIG domain-containing protein [Chloroflexota bacterium]